MKNGKVSETVLKRSILKQMQEKRPETIIGASYGADCAAVAFAPEEACVIHTNPMTFTQPVSTAFGFHSVRNSLSVVGARMSGITVTALFPPETEEAQIKASARELADACAAFHVEALGGHTEITSAVVRPVFSFTGIGAVSRAALEQHEKAQPGDDLVLTKSIGLAGTSYLAQARRAALLERIPEYLVDRAVDFAKAWSITEEAEIARTRGARAMHDLSFGGVFGGLWEFAEQNDIGMEIDLKRIPLEQETVEICEIVGCNPYELLSTGSLLLATADGGALVQALKAGGIPAAVIGKATNKNDRCLHNEDEVRYIDVPKPDALYQVFAAN